ncbi:MAG: hypothetical protein Q8O87_01810 [bacterium]|nr:hypothetical protein [bacterium]
MASSKIKIIALSTALTITALFLGYAISVFVATLSISSGITLLVALAIFLSIFSFQALLIDNRYLTIGLCLLETLGLLVPLYKSWSLILMIAGVVAFLLLVSALWETRKDLANALKIDFLKIARSINTRASIAIVLLGVTLYIGAMTFQDITDSIMASTDPVVQQAANSFFPKELTSDIINQTRQLILEQLEQVPENIQKLVVIGFGILLFLGVKSLTFIINWLSALIAALLYKILLSTKFIVLSIEDVPKETISL